MREIYDAFKIIVPTLTVVSTILLLSDAVFNKAKDINEIIVSVSIIVSILMTIAITVLTIMTITKLVKIFKRVGAKDERLV